MQIKELVTESLDTYNNTADGGLHYVGRSFNEGVIYFVNIILFHGTGGYVISCLAFRQIGALPALITENLFSTSQHYLQMCVHRFYLNRTITVGNTINIYPAQ
jgi:hypothetical protein